MNREPELEIGDITIPLARVQQSQIGNKNEYVKLIQDYYANQYLQSLGVEPSRRHRKQVARHAPLEQCEIEAAWSEDSAMAQQLRITQPSVGRRASLVAQPQQPAELSRANSEPMLESERQAAQGAERSASVAPPDGPDGAAAPGGAKQPARPPGLESAGTGWQERALLAMQAHDLAASEGANAELTEELEIFRRRARGDAQAEVGPALVQWGEDGQKELAELKRKFILPFAAARRAEAEPLLWQAPGPLARIQIQVPIGLVPELLRPVEVTLPQIMQEAVTYVDSRLPLELLTTRKDPWLFTAMREQLTSPGAVRLIGLLSHYVYWLALGHLHSPSQRLPEVTRESLVLTVQELWGRLLAPLQQRRGRRAELLVRDAPAGMCFVLPVLLLGLKRGVESVFQMQYYRVFSDLDHGEVLSDQLVDQINVHLTTLFDPDCTHASFGALDSTVEAIKAWRKLHVVQMKMGLTPATRMLGRNSRTSPAVDMLVGGGGPSDPRTRILLSKSNSESAVGRTSQVAAKRPPLDARRKTVLYRTVRTRLASSGLAQLEQRSAKVV